MGNKRYSFNTAYIINICTVICAVLNVIGGIIGICRNTSCLNVITTVISVVSIEIVIILIDFMGQDIIKNGRDIKFKRNTICIMELISGLSLIALEIID